MSVKKNPDFGPYYGLSPGRNDSGPPTTLGDMPVTYLLDTAIAAALETAVAAGSALGAALGTIVTPGSGIGIAIGMESYSGPLSGPGGGGEDVDPDEDDDEGGTGTTGSPWKPWIPPDAPEQWPKNNKWDGTTERRGQKPQDGNDPDPDDDDFSDSIEWLMESLQPSHTFIGRWSLMAAYRRGRSCRAHRRTTARSTTRSCRSTTAAWSTTTPPAWWFVLATANCRPSGTAGGPCVPRP